MTTKKSDDTPPYRSIEIEAAELNKMDESRLSSFTDLTINYYRGGVLDLRFLGGTPSITGLSVEVPNDEAAQFTTEEWILPTRSRVTHLSLYGVQPDSSSIDTFSAWGLDFFALLGVNYRNSSYQHFNRLMTKRLEMRNCSFSSLPELKRVDNIVINDCDIDIMDLNNINSKYLKSLDLDYSGLSNEHLRQIRQIISLEILILRNLGKDGSIYPSLQGVDYSLLDDHPNLRSFRVTGIKGAFDIPRLPSLETLSLSDIASEEIDLSPLANSKTLHRLYLDTYQNTSADFHPLNQLDLSPLASCTHLQSLYLTGDGVMAIDLTPLLHIESLDELLIYEGPCTKLFADSRFKDKVESPSIRSLDKCGKVEWR